MIIVIFANQFLILNVEVPSFGIERTELIDEGSCRVHYLLSSSDFKTSLNVVMAPIDSLSQNNLPIYIFFDGSYRWSSSRSPFETVAVGLLSELGQEARERNYGGKVDLINLDQLNELLENRVRAVLLIPTQAFWTLMPPPQIEKSLLLSWINDGGIVFWIGAYPPERKAMFTFLSEISDYPDLYNLTNWQSADFYHTNLTDLGLVSSEVEGSSIRIRNDDLSSAGKGFWGTFNPPGTWNMSLENLYLSLSVKVSDLTNLSLVFVQLMDKDRNFRHYYLFPQRSEMAGDWVHFNVSINDPDYRSENPLDLSQVDSLNINAVVGGGNIQAQTAVEISVKDMSLVRGVEMIPPPLPLAEATTDSEISDALNLKYGYVNLGSSIDSISLLQGKILGKTRDNRTSIGMVPMGAGRIIVFGYGIFPPFNQEIIAWDVMQILQSRILYTTEGLRYKSYSLEGNRGVQDFLDLSVKNTEKLAVFVFSKDPYHSFFYEAVLNAD
jgi:hypothetical protein